MSEKRIKELEKLLRIEKKENKELRRLLEVRMEILCDSCGASSMMPMPCKVLEAKLKDLKIKLETLTKEI